MHAIDLATAKQAYTPLKLPKIKHGINRTVAFRQTYLLIWKINSNKSMPTSSVKVPLLAVEISDTLLQSVPAKNVSPQCDLIMPLQSIGPKWTTQVDM